MGPPAIVKGQIAANQSTCLGDTVVGPQIDLLVFDAAPEPLDKHIVAPSPLAILMLIAISFLRSTLVKSRLVNWLL
ncbi:hypothetical protein AA309_28795 [Microvirga vignae]|uniref:Uncharacterized protein n=1 Tax=Microvirga vignae TaxID=1225564 RepID=A0A0H1RBE8_9HYPH|nr:hypothetical protein AA309_28795 [Microvirga vignae]